ncbi:hypothetical protein ACFHW2_40785 [Actinomadura sp. LOL_016]|uniref:DUF4190 domain-containing protein n=1 Tax=unclassified Actinomadura TaxID=2626254 RepID=UPI003A80F223
MSEQPGHPAPEDDRPDGRPAGGPPADAPAPEPSGPSARDETPGRPDLPERSEKPEPPAGPEQPERAGTPGRADLPEPTGKPEQAAPEQREHIGTPGRPDLPERSGGPRPWGTPEQGQQGQQQGPWGQPQRPQGEPAKPGQRPGERSSWRSLWLGGLALLTAFFFYPLGLVLGVAALVVGVRSRRTARREHGSAPGAAAGIVLGSIGLVLASLSVALTAYLWSELSGYQSCVGSANTGIDRQTCQDEWFPKIEDRMGLPEGSMDDYGDLL